GFQCPPDLKWLHEFILAKGFFLFGKGQKMDEALAGLLKAPGMDYARLYALGKMCLQAGRDEEAEKFLLAAKKSVDPKDKEAAAKIDFALNHPEIIADDDNLN